MTVKGFQIDVSISELNDVDTTGSPPIAQGDALIYNSSTQKFEQTPSPIFTGLDALPDVTITKAGSPLDIAEKELLSYDTTTNQWINRKIPDAGLLVSSTGLMTGGEVQFGTLSGSPATTTTVTISAGSGIVVDNHTDPENPTYTTIAWTEFTDVTVTSLAVADRTFFGINSAGALLQQTIDFTPAGHRDIIHLGNAGHANNVNIVGIRNNPRSAFDPTIRLGDLAEAIGAFNVTGNVYAANGANLNLDKSSGESYRLGNNFHTSKKSPDITEDAVDTALSFNYSYRDGSGGYQLTAATTTVDSAFYDTAAGGSPPVLTAVPQNDWQIQLIKHFPGGAGHRIEYGQTTYATKAAAIAAIPDANHAHNPDFAEGIVRGYMILSDSATDLSDPAEAEFVEAGRFGVSGAAGSTGGGIFTSSFESPELGIAPSTEYLASHGLGVIPSGQQAFLRCKTAEYGYAIDDEVEFSNGGDVGSPPTPTHNYKGLYANVTNIYWYTGLSLVITNRTDGAQVAVTPANWKIVLRAYA